MVLLHPRQHGANQQFRETKIMKKMFLLAACGTAMLLVGCAGVPGDKESDVPPRIVQSGDNRQWDNGSAFGPVPESLVKKGNSICASLNTKDTKYVATGYHSKAQDLSGKTFPTGGFFCAKE